MIQAFIGSKGGVGNTAAVLMAARSARTYDHDVTLVDGAVNDVRRDVQSLRNGLRRLADAAV